MKHFAEARKDALSAARGVDLAPLCERLCLIWDVQGRLRVLAKPVAGREAVLSGALAPKFQAAAEAYWSGETWVWREKLESSERVVYERAWSEGRVVASGTPEVRELDRHLSKETWFGQPLSPPWPLINPDATPPILAFYSFKGGVGRTTALISVALQLARRSKRVCVIDLDLEAPGLGTVMVSNAASSARFGVVDYLLEQPVGSAPPELDDYFHLFDLPPEFGTGHPPITVVPAGTLDSDYLEKLARVDFTRLVQPDPKIDTALTALLKQLRRERKPDVILIDARAGLHDIGGLALNGLAHLDVLFALDTEQSWAGLEVVVHHLGRRRTEAGQGPQTCVVVYSMAPAPSDTERDRRIEAFRDRSHSLFSGHFYEVLPQSGWTDPDSHWEVPAIADAGEPHYALPIAYNRDIQGARSLLPIVRLLIEGDFASFASDILERAGMTLT